MTGYTLDISVFAAVSSCLALSSLFVVSLYLWTLAGYGKAGRDEPGTIQRRFLSTLISSACSTGLIFWLAQPAHDSQGFTPLEMLGLQPEGLARACISCLALTASLFTGPLVQGCIAYFQHTGRSSMASTVSPWVHLRNYVMAPITEEFVFRACLLRLCVSAMFPVWAILVCSPACFALAHAHHFFEHIRKARAQGHAYQSANAPLHAQKQNANVYVWRAVKRAVLEVTFQIFYTSLFGVYSCFLLLRTGSTVAVILAHSFCNFQGFPDLSFCAQSDHSLYSYRWLLGALYIIGIVAFGVLMMPITSGCFSPFDQDVVLMRQH